ncbi:MAG TPA: hypothetical protein ENJ77_00985 [Candidatus Moranbacteria bacterium]|nr:hypothetical protein [Candidatus Moranbacteria bacterium]
MAEFLSGLHVIAGLLGTFLPVGVLVETFKSQNYSAARARLFAAGALFFLAVSWLSGGAFYVGTYGSEIKPVIKSSSYPWVHSIVMESKEHIFLFMPVLAAVLLVAVWSKNVKKPLVRSLSISLLILGILMAVSGKIISGTYESAEETPEAGEVIQIYPLDDGASAGAEIDSPVPTTAPPPPPPPPAINF